MPREIQSIVDTGYASVDAEDAVAIRLQTFLKDLEWISRCIKRKIVVMCMRLQPGPREVAFRQAPRRGKVGQGPDIAFTSHDEFCRVP